MSITFNIRQLPTSGWLLHPSSPHQWYVQPAINLLDPTVYYGGIGISPIMYGLADQTAGNSALATPLSTYSSTQLYNSSSDPNSGAGTRYLYLVPYGTTDKLGYDNANWLSMGWTTGTNATFLNQLCTWYAANMPTVLPSVTSYNLDIFSGTISGFVNSDIQIFPLCYIGNDPDAQQVIVI